MALTNRPGGLLVTRGLGGTPTQVIVRGFLPFLVDQVVDAAERMGRGDGRRHRSGADRCAPAGGCGGHGCVDCIFSSQYHAAIQFKLTRTNAVFDLVQHHH